MKTRSACLFFVVFNMLFVSVFCFAQQSLPKIIGGIPNANSTSLYEIQVGAYSLSQNAVNNSNLLRNNGFNVIFENYQNLTRVIAIGIPAREIIAKLEKIKRLGFNEVIIRQDRRNEVIIRNDRRDIAIPEKQSHTVEVIIKIEITADGNVIINERAPNREGLTEDINNLIPDDILEAIGDIGIEIHRGRNPPNIEGTFIFSPHILVRSNFSDFLSPGHQFADARITFSKQDNTNLTVFTEHSHGDSIGSGSGSFITGSGNKFSVFMENSGTIEGYPFESVDIFSGEITSSGIINFHWALIITVEAPNTIKRGQGRLVYDSDGFSERVEK